MKPEAFLQRQKQLIEQEKSAEMQEVAVLHKHFPPKELERRGFALLNLTVTGIRTALGGKCVMDLEAGPGVEELPPHKLGVGDIVSIQPGSTLRTSQSTTTDSLETGLVYRVVNGKIMIVLKELPDNLQDRVSIFKMANNVTYERMTQAIETLSNLVTQGNHSSCPPLETLLQSQSPRFSSPTSIEWFDETLNPSQQEAVQFALSASDIALVHGPPGTGKTYTCVEIIRQLVKRGERVLVCGPSNISVDNLVDRLAKTRLDIVRVGHPARILESVLLHSLEIRVKSCQEGQIVKDVRNDLDRVLKGLPKCRNKQERRAAYAEIKLLRKEVKVREKQVVDTILGNCQVVLSTLNGSSSKSIEKLVQQQGLFDTVLIDEATQALEAECWIAILKAKKVILAGDHLQLPPTVKSTCPPSKDAQVAKYNLEYTLFDRCLDMYGNTIKRLLNVQYRANHMIMNYSSKALYEDRLLSHESVKDRLLTDLSDIKETDDTTVPLVFLDTAGCDMYEMTQDDDKHSLLLLSKYNENEAALLVEHMERLLSAGVSESDIAIISPYSAQVDLLYNMVKSVHPGIEIGTVDGFQGREKEAVLISLVRSNDKGDIGFLSEKRRLNVAITRPKRHLFVVGDSFTLSRGNEPFLKGFLEYMEQHADLRFP